MTAPPGPALVIAGAGSGKTRTLTYRVAYLLEQGIPPERILLLTFTNKAAQEMMRRVADLLGGELSGLWGGTFHSIGDRVLRRHAPLLGYQPDFSILDREDAKDMLQACLAEMDIDLTASPFSQGRRAGRHFFPRGQQGDAGARNRSKEQFDYFAELAPQIGQLQEELRGPQKGGQRAWISTTCSPSGSNSCASSAEIRDEFSSGASSSFWWTNIRTRTKSRAT